MRTIKLVEGGIHCVQENSDRTKGHRVRFADQPSRFAAAVPSLLAESLARTALSRTTEDRVAGYRDCLREWVDHSVLFDLTLEEEIAICSGPEPINSFFRRRPKLMPKVITTWDPRSTTIDISAQGVAVIFKDGKGQNLLRVTVDVRKLDAPPCHDELVLVSIPLLLLFFGWLSLNA